MEITNNNTGKPMENQSGMTKEQALSHVVLTMALYDITYRDFMEFIGRNSRDYERLRNIRKNFDEQAALEEFKDKGG